MKLADILRKLYVVHKSNANIAKPWICGGIPRDKVIGTVNARYEDLDITTGDASVRFLAEEFAKEMRKNFEINTKTAQDGHVSVHLDNLKIDFSSNFVIPNIDIILAKMGIPKPNPLQREMFSRDFTCNALLLSLNLKDISDPTGRGLKDINEKMIRTCLAPEISLTNKHDRMARVFYVAAKTGFSVDPSILDWMRRNAVLIREVDGKYLANKLERAMELDPERTVALLNETNMWDHIPPIPSLLPYMKGRVMGPQ